MVKFNNMINKDLENLINNKQNKSNKDLANNLLIIEDDFNKVKDSILKLTEIMRELEIAYDAIYDELQSRLKFKVNDEN